MLSQQMRSSDCIKLEDGDLQLSLLPSNLVGNYIHHHTNNIPNEPSTVIDSLITDTYSLLLAELLVVRSDNALELLNTFSLSPVVRNDVHSDDDNLHEQSTIGVDDFSQSIACIATRFRECGSTLLDKLWYTYSYIYKPTTTICYGIYIFLNSRHTGPFRLLPCKMCQAYYSFLINYLGSIVCEFHQIYHLPISGWC